MHHTPTEVIGSKLPVVSLRMAYDLLDSHGYLLLRNLARWFINLALYKNLIWMGYMVYLERDDLSIKQIVIQVYTNS